MSETVEKTLRYILLRLDRIEVDIGTLVERVTRVESAAGGYPGGVRCKPWGCGFGGPSLSVVKQVMQRSEEESTHQSDTPLRFVPVLKTWTGAQSADVVFDSVEDGEDSWTFNATLEGKAPVAVLCWTEDGDAFGVMFTEPVEGKCVSRHPFSVCSFESHGRCITPQRFSMNPARVDQCEVQLRQDRNGICLLCRSGDASLLLQDGRRMSRGVGLGRLFSGMEDTTLVGLSRGAPFRCVRLVVVHLH